MKYRNSIFGLPPAAGIGGYGLPRPSGLSGLLQQYSGAASLLDCERRAFTDQEKVSVWCKGRTVPFRDAAYWRYDDFGNLIHRDAYGRADSPFGWEIDHIQALAIGGTNDLNNLRPLRCKTNRGLGGILGALQGR